MQNANTAPQSSTLQQSSKKIKRPFGIYAILVFLLFLIVNNGLDVVRSWQGLPPHTFPELGTAALIIWNGALFVLCVILAVGLWRMQDWAWYAAMIASGLSLFFMIWRYFNGGEPYVDMLLLVVIIFYLNQREVKGAFKSVQEAGVSK